MLKQDLIREDKRRENYELFNKKTNKDTTLKVKMCTASKTKAHQYKPMHFRKASPVG